MLKSEIFSFFRSAISGKKLGQKTPSFQSLTTESNKNSREVYLKVFKLTSNNGERQSIVARDELAVIDNR